jgi:hypothetical protein
MVERNLEGITLEELAAAQRAAIDTGRQLTVAGKAIRYIRSTFVLGESRCMCLFEAPSAERVKELNDMARLPYRSIVEALDLTPLTPGGGRTRDERTGCGDTDRSPQEITNGRRPSQTRSTRRL